MSENYDYKFLDLLDYTEISKEDAMEMGAYIRMVLDGDVVIALENWLHDDLMNVEYETEGESDIPSVLLLHGSLYPDKKAWIKHSVVENGYVQSIFDAKGKLDRKTIYEVNENGDDTKAESYLASGELDWSSVYEYNDIGDLMKETEYDGAGNVVEEHDYSVMEGLV